MKRWRLRATKRLVIVVESITKNNLMSYASALTYSSILSPLPHAKRGGSFLLHRQTLADLFLLGSGMPCAARTFLSPSGLAPRGQRQTGLLSFFVV